MGHCLVITEYLITKQRVVQFYNQNTNSHGFILEAIEYFLYIAYINCVKLFLRLINLFQVI